jgi:carbonic anhydrase
MVRLLLSGLLLVLSTGAVFAGAATVHWTYEGEEGPEHWGELSPDFTLCKDGVNQSPVDLVADLHAELPELLFQYHGTPIREINNGHTIQLNVSPGNFLEVPEKAMRYELKQVHFHSPSEHTVDGESFAMEIHLVHSNEDGHLAVVGVMIEEGEEDPMLNRIWSFMPEKVGESTESPLTVFEAGVMPPTRDYFAYNGSLTTPPCSEGVRWIVLSESLTASVAQIGRFKERVGPATNRPVQDHNARIILDGQ